MRVRCMALVSARIDRTKIAVSPRTASPYPQRDNAGAATDRCPYRTKAKSSVPSSAAFHELGELTLASPRGGKPTFGLVRSHHIVVPSYGEPQLFSCNASQYVPGTNATGGRDCASTLAMSAPMLSCRPVSVTIVAASWPLASSA